MSIKKSVILVTAAAALLLGAAGCSNNNAVPAQNTGENVSVRDNNATPAYNLDHSNGLPTDTAGESLSTDNSNAVPTDNANEVRRGLRMGGGIMPNIAGEYMSVAEVKKKSEEIVHLKAISYETIEKVGFPSTITNAEVLSVIEGSLSKGDIIKLVQTGAINGEQEISMPGDPIFRPGDEMVLFLVKAKVDNAEDAYLTVGFNEGRFDVINSKIHARGPQHISYSSTPTPIVRKEVKRSDSIAEMSYYDITRFSFTVEEFSQKIRELKD
ncbi:hypothetical protein [Acetivibrio straminisolvens]|jgi:hypothetical protein|uniref:Uncharacterized protein n=1 Tax=Acetivibrio straminisolvens JCM 21531 TaxID=1294263 RepID=W4V210_9FIRM|nr:hypothetical protein [Acetivibrio straminisolvens]GAE87256.1 hypothetical protein JCM21531_611 [Acetivibrio straminisolvens JCM 21531]